MSNILRIRLNFHVSTFLLTTAFVAFSPQTSLAGVCFLPDCEQDLLAGDPPPNPNADTKWCEKNGYTYFSSGECPKYYVKETCPRDEFYLKCDGAKWCKQNGYNIQSCPSNQHGAGQCPNGMNFFQKCACNTEYKYNSSNCNGNSIPEGQSCSDDSGTKYNQCNCYPSPAPSNYSYTCTGTDKVSDGCGKYYYRCCSDNCPSGSSKNYSGTYAGKTECGNSCYKCKACPSGSSTSYTGTYAGTTECNGGQSCYRCNDTCKSGQKSVSCSSTENRVRVSTTECGNSCYQCQYNTDCSVTSKSCDYGCASYNSCNKCTSCNTHTHSYSCPYGYSSSCSNGYSSTTSRSCSCGATSGTCYKCKVNTCTDTCSSKGYSSSKPSGKTCSTTTVCGQTCYYNCQSSCTDTCSSKGYSSSKPSGKTCSTTTVCGKTCYYNCKDQWKYVYKDCEQSSIVCWNCGHQQYCGSLYNKGYAPVYACTTYCKNLSTGAYKKICRLSGYGIFSLKAETKAQCQANVSSSKPKVPSGESTIGDCDSSGSHACSY